MKTFREYLIEGNTKLIIPGRSDTKIPVSISAQNINVAKKEIYALVTDDISYVIPDEIETEFRSVYNIKNAKIYTWFAVDAMHESIETAFKIDSKNSIHLTIDVRWVFAFSNSDGPVEKFQRFSPKEVKKWKSDLEKYFGKSKLDAPF